MLRKKESDPSKGAHYLSRLDVARCNAQWQDLPELIRKLAKHLPHRECLILAAQSEPRIASTETEPGLSRSDPSPLTHLAATLETAIQKENSFLEDVLQARTCLAWVYMAIGSTYLALSSLPNMPDPKNLESGVLTQWTHVCIVKCAYIRGKCLEEEGKKQEAVKEYTSMLPYLSKTDLGYMKTPEHRRWTLRLLGTFCALAYSHVLLYKNHPDQLISVSSPFSPTEILVPFRAFANHCQQNPKLPTEFCIWQDYFQILSFFLHHGIMQPIFESKRHQASATRKIQALCKVKLKEDLSFPAADEKTLQIDVWVDQVMTNWRILTGPTWKAEDLGEGGRIALTEQVTDTLFEAATRSFQSTRVLRHLFTLHTAAGDIPVANRALDTYIDYVLKGQAKAQKSGKSDVSLDDYATVLGAAAAGIKMRCYYGRPDDVEKSEVLAATIVQWIQDLCPEAVADTENLPKDLSLLRSGDCSSLYRAVALGYHALGVSQYSRACQTHETRSRSILYDKAIASFEQALFPSLGQEDDVELLFSLAIAHAAMQDLPAAIRTVKKALQTNAGRCSSNETSSSPPNKELELRLGMDSDRRGFLLRSWLLLASLMCAREKYDTAVKCCEAALEMYGNKTILHGNFDQWDVPENVPMSERKNMIEVKMTHLAVIECTRGSREAINHSGELVGLYCKLFNQPNNFSEPPKADEKPPPPSADGTVRSFRNSVLGLPVHFFSPKSRPRALESRDQRPSSSHGSLAPPKLSKRVPANATARNRGPPVSQNLNDLAIVSGRNSSNRLVKHGSRNRVADQRSDDVRNGNTYKSNEVGIALTHDLPATPPSQGPKHSIRSILIKPLANLALLPLVEPEYKGLAEERHRSTVLAKIWLLISGCYRGASMLVDAQGAVDEAKKCALSVETAVVRTDGSSAKSLADLGYGGLKSCGDLWADIYSGQGAVCELEGDYKAAAAYYEKALGYDADHVAATVGLCKRLLATYREPLPGQDRSVTDGLMSIPTLNPVEPSEMEKAASIMAKLSILERRERLQARDRAGYLLSALTKSPRAWDNAEAWSLLGAEFELSGHSNNSTGAYARVVTLTGQQGLRSWKNIVL